MKKLIAAVLLFCMITPALAEVKPTQTQTPLEQSAGQLLDSLGQTWDALVGFAGEAGKSATEWWDGASKDIDRFLAENAPEVKQWLNDAGEYFDKQVSPELQKSWEMLVESAAQIGTYTQTELQKAYDEIMSSMNASNTTPEVRKAVENIAEAAGVKTDK